MMKLYKMATNAALLSAYLFASKALAQIPGGAGGGLNTQGGIFGGQVEGVAKGGFVETLGSIINYFLGFVGLVAVLILIYGGFTMITSQGEEDKFKEGRQMIIYAVIGIVVIVISYTLVGTLISGISGL